MIYILPLTLIIAIGLFLIGVLLGIKITKCTCDGEIVMKDDYLYLNLTKSDIKTLENAEVVKLKLRRDNFQGFNES